MKKKLIAGVLALALVATAFAVGTAQNTSSGPGPMGTGGSCSCPCNMSQLTDEQKQAIEDQLQDYEQNLLAEYGIILTDEQMDALQQAIQEQRQESRQHQFGPHNYALTDEERQELKEQMESQREARQQKLQELLDQYGIDLTNEEWQEIREQLREYRQELLEEYGISCPCEPFGAGTQYQGQNGGIGQGMQGFRRGPGFGECTQSFARISRARELGGESRETAGPPLCQTGMGGSEAARISPSPRTLFSPTLVRPVRSLCNFPIALHPT